MKRTILLSLLLALTLGAFAQPSTPKKAPEKPSLVVVISVDQMKAEYIDWFGHQWSGGLKRLYAEGAVYSNAMLDYAASETGPGHATLSTGSFPRTHGILGNEWVDPKTRKDVYCVEDSLAKPVDGLGGGMSARNLAVSALGDWLKASSKSSKVISLSVKDRAAVLMGGKNPDQVYWYDRKTGKLVTSSAYAKVMAPWMKAFNDQNWVFKHVPPVWSKLLADSLYLGPDDQRGEQLWNGSRTMPKVFNLAMRSEQMAGTPWGDLLILDAAKAAVEGEKLGQRNVTDLLMISLSSTDYVGHAYGVNSHEMQDHLARVDAALGQFLADLERIIGRDRMLVALSADHACMPLPEYLQDVEFRFSRRLNVGTEVRPKTAALDSTLRLQLGATGPLFGTNGFINYSAAPSNVKARALEGMIGSGLRAIDGIADVYFKFELIDTTVPMRPYLDRFRNSYYPPRGEDFQLRFPEYVLPSSRETGTSHGSCYNYDNHVPLLFWGPTYTVNRVTRPVRTVDAAVTIAKVLNLRTPKTVNGLPLTEVLVK
ncbi:MAG: alkaline phosphatase family protein [Bacteroidetes bacterium]|jgi:predicted AlkP superfamily pyrophosphatase or phosphodiesterase|nr:alkaline phosphatase family protein [Bacteroidota bacterium]